MDTSEQYIKMCKKAEEIQKLRPIEPPFDKWMSGDFYTVDCPLGPCVSVHNDTSAYGLGKFTTWLPRQDQLQEMGSEKDFYLLLKDLDSFAVLGDWQDKGLFTSMEQLWLAFVMKERYNKVWNGGEWISG